MTSECDLAGQNLKLIEATFDQLPYPAIIYDNGSAVVAVNQACQTLLGTSAANSAGRSCSEILHCRSCDQDCSVLAGLGKRPVVAERAVRIVTRGGRDQLAFVRVSPLAGVNGTVRGTLAIFTSVIEPASPQRQAIVAESDSMREILDFARRVAASEATTILLDGECGTGKELVARLLHNDSRRSSQPFVAINCAAMPETLLESELFGYEKGAFTGARSTKRGLFELADKGTLFLDEIGELPLTLQAKLLRVLDDRKFRRLGGLHEIQSDIRIVAATNRDLRLAVTERVFRRDLYYRINVIQLTIPPLRDRRDDILPLAWFFIEHFSRKFRRSAQALSPETARLLLAYDWPGNVRELRNLIEHSALLEETDSISADSLPSYIQDRTIPIDQLIPTGRLITFLPDPTMSLKASENLMVTNAMTKAQGNQTKAAKLLRISRDALRSRLKTGHRFAAQG